MIQKNKKSQIIEEIFKYGLVLVLAGIVVATGYKFIASIKENACQSEIAKFELDLRVIGNNVRLGEKEIRSYKAPCNVDRIYIFDINKSINPDSFEGMPIIKDSLETGGSNNVFLVKDSQVVGLFYAGIIEIDSPHYICFSTLGGDMGFYLEGKARATKVSAAPGQKLCS